MWQWPNIIDRRWPRFSPVCLPSSFPVFTGFCFFLFFFIKPTRSCARQYIQRSALGQRFSVTFFYHVYIVVIELASSVTNIEDKILVFSQPLGGWAATCICNAKTINRQAVLAISCSRQFRRLNFTISKWLTVSAVSPWFWIAMYAEIFFSKM